MYNIPPEYLAKRAAHEVAHLFANKVEENWHRGKVAVLLNDFLESLYFVQRDEYGYPTHRDFHAMEIDSLTLQTFSSHADFASTTLSVSEIRIYVSNPLMVQQIEPVKPHVFLWRGQHIDSRKVPLEQLNVSELMKLAQAVIQNREGLIIDEALRNKIYK